MSRLWIFYVGSKLQYLYLTTSSFRFHIVEYTITFYCMSHSIQEAIRSLFNAINMIGKLLETTYTEYVIPNLCKCVLISYVQ